MTFFHGCSWYQADRLETDSLGWCNQHYVQSMLWRSVQTKSLGIKFWSPIYFQFEENIPVLMCSVNVFFKTNVFNRDTFGQLGFPCKRKIEQILPFEQVFLIWRRKKTLGGGFQCGCVETIFSKHLLESKYFQCGNYLGWWVSHVGVLKQEAGGAEIWAWQSVPRQESNQHRRGGYFQMCVFICESMVVLHHMSQLGLCPVYESSIVWFNNFAVAYESINWVASFFKQHLTTHQVHMCQETEWYWSCFLWCDQNWGILWTMIWITLEI